MQLSHNIPKDDGQNIQGRNSRSMGHNLHGRHLSLCQGPTQEFKKHHAYQENTMETKGQQPLSQARKMFILGNTGGLPRLHTQQKQDSTIWTQSS